MAAQSSSGGGGQPPGRSAGSAVHGALLVYDSGEQCVVKTAYMCGQHLNLEPGAPLAGGFEFRKYPAMG